MTVLYLVGWLVFARMLPTPSPHLTAEQLSQWLVEHKPGILIGCLLMVAGCGLWGSWVAAIAVWTFRTEARFPVLTFTQLICVAAGLTFFIFDTLFWAVASFRAGETDPHVTQQMWDVGWFGFLFTITVYIAWAIAWALGVLLNPSKHQMFPRWTAYITFGSVTCWSPGLLVVFFKEGPFSYAGPLAMWLPISEFFVWLVFIDIYARKAVKRQIELSRSEARTRGPEFDVHPPRDGDTISDSSYLEPVRDLLVGASASARTDSNQGEAR
ncbi:hypothetical protein ACFXG4_42370 [Nocardia sp. NPDC059246]|uniref:hypothetical protein n=1 Tax=unclassified Nocardia TaxID=2637762 RepID=UPI0036B963FB